MQQNIKNGTFILGDCLEEMRQIPDGVVDMILCDLPYGTTACKWDTIIPFDKLWGEYWRIAKPNAAIVLTCSQPFTSALGFSQIKYLKRSLVWNKRKAGNIAQSAYMELKIHEDILIFHKEKPTYNPQKVINDKPETRHLRKKSKNTEMRKESGGMGGEIKYSENYEPDKKLPTTIIEFSKETKPIHPTQKPVALFEYLIKTYTNEGDLVLDNCAGSGTTAIAAENTNRRWVCIEQDEPMANKAVERIINHTVLI